MYEFPGVTFLPWIGKHYEASCFGIRLLVLGESHYHDDPRYSDCHFTQEVVHTLGQTERARFFTVTAKVLYGSSAWISDDARSKIWEHVAFYNFVQSVVSRPRVPPAFVQWCAAQAPFATVLQSLKPHAVLILGWRLSDHLAKRPENITFKKTIHPSSGRFRYENAIPAFKKLLADAGGHLPHFGDL